MSQSTPLRNIFGRELELAFERFNEETPKTILFRGASINPVDGLLGTLSNRLYTSSVHYSIEKHVTLVTTDQARASISFFGTTPEARRDHFVSVTVLAGVAHDGNDYILDIEGIADVQEIPTGASIDDLLAEAKNTAPAAVHYLRGNMSHATYGELTTIYSQKERVYTGLQMVLQMIQIAESNYPAIRQAIVDTFANDQIAVDLELESAIWFANLHRYNATEPMFNAQRADRRNPMSLSEIVGPTTEGIVRDLELMLLTGPKGDEWIARRYMSLEAIGLGPVDMHRNLLQYTEDLLAKSSVFTCKAFSKYEAELRATLESSKLRIVAGLQREIMSQAKTEVEETTVPAPAVVVNERVTAAGDQLRRFDLEVMKKNGDRVFIVVERPESEPLRIGATIDMTDVTYIDLTGDDGENYSVFWCDWNKKSENFVIDLSTEEPAQIVTTFYDIVE